MSQPFVEGSIRSRLLFSLLAGSALLAIVLYFIIQSVAQQVAQDSQDNVLTASALSISESARTSGKQINIDLPYFALSMLDSISDERVFYAIRLDGELLSGYGNLPVPNDVKSDQPAFLSKVFLGDEVRIVTTQRTLNSNGKQRLLTVSVAQTLTGQAQTLDRFSRTSMGIGAGFFVLSVILAGLVSRSTISPLERLTASVSRRGPKELRPVAAPVPKEMAPLVTSLNSFMERLQKSLSRSEDFIAEAAHRLRTPLAVVRAKAEVLKKQSNDSQTQATIAEMIDAIDNSSRTAGQLLDHAMVTFRLDNLTQDKIKAYQMLDDAVDRVRPIAELKSMTISVKKSDAAYILGDAILLQSALLNIFDNAIKYTPDKAKISVKLNSNTQNRIDISICDDGAGFDLSKIDKLTDRFERGGGTHGIVGSGLGLSIAKEVIEAHGGTITLSNPKGAGACVLLSLPSHGSF